MVRINLTQHNASLEQGCEPRSEEMETRVRELLTFEELPDLEAITARAIALAEIAEQESADEAMIGGAPWLMPSLDAALRLRGIQPVYAFSRRESVEVQQEDGSTRKMTRFRHLGFIRF